ncbi:MAG TPA: hydrogenase maturation nickel metallochaperone HypA [Thermoflexales bacterium]|nr:hydrogenase maturation nickel metallochaperone HypA [Thermoflexales bacterium]HQW36645.1 hydrogenase maturation nickel metallochaperone HypA [Thermoflexales bacterium]HQX76716.1 hydrogenase maturation nickel metallochaperone HypA [Thermoflexales bacterium]HQZ22119.1 hydrogenase maturation nickel metallochaperone HypA [Thermoflexales bacterium]HQZ99364.1 hydrogenase maturation nickel metallochaperone HypA [Thermoflexales bacterium]
MHELSIAHELVNIADEAARKAGATRVTRVHLRLGALSGVVKDSLLFGYGMATQGTLLDGSELVVNELPVVIYCDSPTCQREIELQGTQSFRCPACGQPAAKLVQGKELQIESIEIDEE